MTVGRFAPSTTGPPHLGTLASALLVWLDARSRGARVILRLEDLDPDRCRPEHAQSIVADLDWLGLTWDATFTQSALADQHAAALDKLAAMGALYPCSASREQLRAIGRRAPDGGFAYDNRARGTPLPEGGWRACTLPLRAKLPDHDFAPIDEGGLDLAQRPSVTFGDPVVRRRDGAIAYQLAVVVDDAAVGVDRVVRGRDIAPSTATQLALMELLNLRPPVYRHHAMLLDADGKKLGKSLGAPRAIAKSDAPQALLGVLAHQLGLVDRAEPIALAELLARFSWHSVISDDRVVALSAL
jgi:glutamyl/glutaminyl-tRNA synthetase